MEWTFRPGGDPLGTHRVVSPRGALPQAADVLDPSLPAFASEVLLAVDCLNIDAASFVQLESMAALAPNPTVAEQILAIVARAGKMHNPVTGSGGMLLGRILATGPAYDGPLRGLPPGTRVATLVSLTLTPLHLQAIRAVRPHAHQVEVTGHAFLPSSAPAAAIPDDLHPTLTLAVLDVCGAPALCERLAARLPANGDVLVLGAGKAGTLALAAMRRARPDLHLWAIDRYEAPLAEVHAAGLCNGTVALDAADALAVRGQVQAWTAGRLCDAVVHMTSLPGSEMAAILACKSRGTCLYFGMATSFPRVALGAEGVGADVELIIGNGYATGHAQAAMELVRAMPEVKLLLERRLGLK